MPRTAAPPTPPPPPPAVSRGASLAAAAKRLPARPDIAKVSRTGRGWQREAWQFFDVIGEYRYGVDWIGNMVSRASLYVAYDGQRVDQPASPQEAAATRYVRAFFGGPESQGQMLRQVAVHLTVAGECFLVGVVRDQVERWHVVAATELTVRSGRYYMGGKQVESDADPLVLRLWRPHPRKYTEATSPSRAVLPILSEIDQLTRFIFAQIDSRLAGAGILVLPSEFTMPGVEAGVDGQQPGTAADRFMAELQEAMTASLGDRESASAVVPIVITAPGEHIGEAKHITFWSDLQAEAKTLRDEAIRRLSLGMDLPPEIMTGTGDVNHWGAWQIDESAIKAHAEPLLGLVTESMTTGYLRPLLVDDGMDPLEAERFSVEADTTELRLRPDRSREAFELYDRGQLSTAALLREVGFSAGDAPSREELAVWFVRKVAAGQTTPELVAAALSALGINLGPVVGEQVPPDGHEARPTPTLTRHPVTGPPQESTTAAAITPEVAAAADVIVLRALERAGNRLRSRLGKPLAGVPAVEAYQHVPLSPGQLDWALEDAFGNLERYTVCTKVPAQVLGRALDVYCRFLLHTGTQHDPQRMHEYLAREIADAQVAA